jgi:hypothetical protein
LGENEEIMAQFHVELGDVHSDADLPESAEQELVLAFAPVHKLAFGVAIGMAASVSLFVATLAYAAREPAVGEGLSLLNQYFWGYSVTLAGAFVGLGWGFATGFVAGWFFAFCRNLIVAASVFLVRAKAELSETRDFLDHI